MIRLKFCKFMKWYSICLMSASIGATLGSIACKDYRGAIYYVVCCAASYFCYRQYSKRLSKTNK